jgi:hypothetical protein
VKSTASSPFYHQWSAARSADLNAIPRGIRPEALRQIYWTMVSRIAPHEISYGQSIGLAVQLLTLPREGQQRNSPRSVLDIAAL